MSTRAESASGPGWTLYQGDCLDPVHGLASLGNRSVDHVITDPPYSEHVHSKQRRTLGNATTSLGFAALGDDQLKTLALEFARVARRWVVVFGAVEDVARWRSGLEDAGLEYIRTGAWVKSNPMPQFTGDRPAVGFEAIVIAHQPGRKRWNGGGRPGVWSFSKAVDTVHETQKPDDLMAALVRDFSDADELVVDPFAGAASTGVACRRLGRYFAGWERDPKYFAAAVKRLTAAREQLRMFEEAG